MKNKFLQADRALERLSLSQQRELLRAYSLALKEIRGKIAEAYAQHGVEGTLTFAEMQKYNRLANLEKSISKEVAKLTGKNAIALKKGMGSIFEESYYRTAFTLETEVQARLGFGKLSPKVIEEGIKNPLDRVGFLQRNRDNQARLTRQLREQLTQGLIQGESYQKTARRIKERMDVGATNVLKIAQTENHRVMGGARMGALEQAESAGVDLDKQWVSALDDQTREDHQEADGQVVGLHEPFDVGGEELDYPGDPAGSAENVINCRCSYIGVIKGYDYTARMAREAAAKRGELIEYKTYKQWKKGRINK